MKKTSARAPESCIPRSRANRSTSRPGKPEIAGDLSYIKNNFPVPLNLSTAPLPTLTLTTVGPQVRSIFAMDFDNSATTLWAIDNGTLEYGTLDQATGAFTVVGTITGLPTGNTTGMKFDPTSGTVYVTTTDDATCNLFTLDLVTGVATLVGPTTGYPLIIDIAISNSGQMYGHDIGAEQLVLIDKATGAVTPIGLTGLTANFAQGMDFDPSDGTLYGYAFVVTPVQQGELVSFDLTTGAATLLDTTPDEMEGAIKVAVPTALPQALSVDVDPPLTGTSNLNHVFEPNETVTIEPTWQNTSLASLGLTGTLSNFTGPGVLLDPIYNLPDTSADYGIVAAGASASCTVTADCYSLEIVNLTRPVQHWDATVDETLSPTASVKTWTLHIGGSFSDVDPLLANDPFYPAIETIFHNGVTAGCGDGTTFCPTQNNLRKEMAIFLLKSFLGGAYTPPTPSPFPPGLFNDVPDDGYRPWIEDLYNRGITGGCQLPGDPLAFCPDRDILRKEMAVFLLKTKLGPAYVPPAPSPFPPGLFNDVADDVYRPWIEDLYNRGITAGCQAPGDPLSFCPEAFVKRQEMAAFLVTTFSLVLYGP